MEFVLGLIILVLDIVAIIGVLQSRLETTMKLVWILLIIILPVIGMVLWYLIGNKQSAAG